MGLEEAVRSLVDGKDESGLFPKPSWAEPRDMLELKREINAIENEAERRILRRERQQEQTRHIQGLRAWWLHRMRYSSWAFREKMTLFWHGHFATAFSKVKDAYLHYQQNETLRREGLGSFPELCKSVSRDPAMLQWLDGSRSQKGSPNENFARELMELFMLGEGNYTERDIQEAARAFTGYRIAPRTQSFVFERAKHDGGTKEIFQKKGKFSGDDVIDLIAQRRQCPDFLAAKLLGFFVMDNPPAPVVQAFSDTLRQKKYDIRESMRVLFSSEVFYSDRAMRSQIKSPVQWLVQAGRSLDVPLPQGQAANRMLEQLGQSLFNPPNVRGWIGGRAWITASAFVLRQKYGREIAQSIPPSTCESWASEGETSPEEAVQRIGLRVFGTPLDERQTAHWAQIYRALREQNARQAAQEIVVQMVVSPEYQLT